MGQEEEIQHSKARNCGNRGFGNQNDLKVHKIRPVFLPIETRTNTMKLFRKMLALMLALVLVLSMSTFVFAAEEVTQPRSCNHSFVPRHVYRYIFISSTKCGYYIDTYEECTLCGYTLVFPGDVLTTTNHFTEDGDSYCWQCHSYGCVMPN